MTAQFNAVFQRENPLPPFSLAAQGMAQFSAFAQGADSYSLKSPASFPAGACAAVDTKKAAKKSAYLIHFVVPI